MRMRLVGLLSLFAAGCFNPNIPEGTIQCGPSAAGSTVGVCPSGLTCATDGYCYRNLPDLGFTVDGGVVSPFGNGALGDPSMMLVGRTGTLELNTETGEIAFLALAGGRTQIVMPMVAGFSIRTQTGGPAVATWDFSNLTVPAGITIAPSSNSAKVLVLESMGDLILLGDVNCSSFGGRGGSSRMAGSEIATNTGGMAAGSGATDAAGSGGGGGGYVTAGAVGLGAGGGNGGVLYGAPNLQPVHFGAGGGGGSASGMSKGGTGGNGGGAIVLFGHKVEIGGTINAAGSRGRDGNTSADFAGGGGGGSGGSILIGGDMVIFDAAGGDGGSSVGATLIATGGAGGSGNSTGGSAGGAGADGRVSIAGVILGIVNVTITPAQVSQSEITAFPR